MANFIEQIELGEELYDLHDSEFIIDNRTAAGAALTGVSKAPVLFDGMQISYWLNHAAGSNVTLNLTLADGTKTGAVPCYYSGTTRLGAHYAPGNVLHMTYRENAVIAGTARGAGWWCDANYYSDTNYDIFGTALKVDTAVYNYSLCGVTGTYGTIVKQTNTNEAGAYWKVNSFTQSAGTETSKKATAKGFYPYKIFYNIANASYTSAGGNTSTVSSGGSNIDLRYTVNGSTSANIGATGAPFFLVGTIESDGLFYLKGDQATKEWWTAGIPTTKNTDYVYWFVGVMSSAYQMRLSDHNWFLKWTGTGDNDHLIQFEPWFTVEHAQSADSVPWMGVTGKPDTFTPTIGNTSTTAAAGNHTHGYIANNGSIADAVAATPASGDKIVITDSSDSNKVKGAITIGADDGKFLKHDGTWQDVSTDDHILVMTGTPTGALDSAPINTTTTWVDYTTAITNHDRLVLDIPLAQSRIEFQAQRDDGSTVNVLYAITKNGLRIVTSASYNATDNNGNVQFTRDSNTVSYSDYSWSADEADSVPWSGITANPYPTSAPSDNGNYVLNINGGSSSWEEAPEGALMVTFGSGFVSSTPKSDIDAAIAAGRPVLMYYPPMDIMGSNLLATRAQDDIDYYYFITPAMGNVTDPTIICFVFVEFNNGTRAIPQTFTQALTLNYVQNLSSSSRLASRVSLDSGLLSFASVNCSEVSGLALGSEPVLRLVPFSWGD